VVDRVRDEAHARSAERAVTSAGIEEGADTLSAARTATAHARAVAHARGVEPETLGIPPPLALAEELAAARARAWRYTEADAVAEAVARWWRWSRFVLLPLINLPLLALFVHVAYRVVTAYVFERYLDLSYFLNAGALSAVLTVAGGVLASWSLWGAAARVRGLAQSRFRAELEDLQRLLGERSTGALRGARQAGDRLAALLPDAVSGG
ncbi:MAG: hypothetical protein M3Y59_12240, partial [Myxococcota bacterium]|nr:hypothetical protein [Myxococcota bacterium]